MFEKPGNVSFAHQYFGKVLMEVGSADVWAFFQQRRSESQHLEFKSGEVGMEKVLKEICAFLNSEGGLLILGAPREVSVPGKENVRESFGQPIPSRIGSVNLLRQAVARGIRPAPGGIKYHQVDIGSGLVFLIDISPSSNPPHQLNGSGVYYTRQGHVSRPALHEEIEKMFLEKRQPGLDLQIELERPEDEVIIRLILESTTIVSAQEPGFALQVFPVRQAPDGKQQVQQVASGNYLAHGQRWVQEVRALPREPRFFISSHYYCRDVDMKQKAVFAEIQKNKILLLEVFNSEEHDNFQWWYDRWSYLLEE